MKVMNLLGLWVATAACAAQASTPPILLEACNLFDDRGKRLECLRAANAVESTPASHGATSQRTSSPTSTRAYAPATPNSLAAFDSPPTRTAKQRSTATRSSGGATCYTGPRGGTYTITASGRKNYGGC